MSGFAVRYISTPEHWYYVEILWGHTYDWVHLSSVSLLSFESPPSGPFLWSMILCVENQN